MHKKKKINSKEIVFVLLLLIGFIIQISLKQFFIENLWNDSLSSQSNGYASVLKNDYEAGYFDFVVSCLYVAIGRIFYILTSTFGLLIFFFEKIIFDFKLFYRSKDKRRLNIHQTLSFFLLLSFILNLGVASIFGREPQYTTHLLYGRYTENLLGPILVVAISFLLNQKSISYKKISFYILIIILLHFMVLDAEKYFMIYDLNVAVNNVGISHLYQDNSLDLTLVSKMCWLSFLLICLWKNSKYIKYNQYHYLLFFSISIIWIGIGMNAYKLFENDVLRSTPKYELIRVCGELEKEIEKDSIIYMYKKDRIWISQHCAEVIQFLLPDIQVEYIDDVNRIKTPCILFFSNAEYEDTLQAKDILVEWEGSVVSYAVY